MKVSDVTAIYYDLVQQQQQLEALDTTIVISKQRLNLHKIDLPLEKLLNWKF
jgi:outer membrane protein